MCVIVTLYSCLDTVRTASASGRARLRTVAIDRADQAGKHASSDSSKIDRRAADATERCAEVEERHLELDAFTRLITSFG